jgi:hypothetical protein
VALFFANSSLITRALLPDNATLFVTPHSNPQARYAIVAIKRGYLFSTIHINDTHLTSHEVSGVNMEPMEIGLFAIKHQDGRLTGHDLGSIRFTNQTRVFIYPQTPPDRDSLYLDEETKSANFTLVVISILRFDVI